MTLSAECLIEALLLTQNRAISARELRQQTEPQLSQQQLDAIIIAVAHEEYVTAGLPAFVARLKNQQGVVMDVKSIFNPEKLPMGVRYWSL